MSVSDAMKEPRRAKCRPPTETELAAAAEEVSERSGERGIEETRRSSSGEAEEPEEPEDGSLQEDEPIQIPGEKELPRKTKIARKRLRSRLTDGDEFHRAQKRKTRISLITKPGP